ncbi:MAG: HD domain-containing protein [Planctomycetes bacterium]|nr:HD domain-containing protein [Planctomycetota bacterium]MBI3834519.1 HD domain-containing protein [Planctomycetota bacterium]
MNLREPKERTILEVMLIVVCLGMTYLMYRMGGYKMVALNLFYLPIVLSGYFLGRSSAGVLALLCTLGVTITATIDHKGFTSFNSPVLMGLAITVWAGVLGLTAILVGTLCDERSAKVEELHDAYVGVVEVLTRYLQSGNLKIKSRSLRVGELCQSVAEEMRLSRKQIDDIRVGALLHDLGKVEITTKLINRAVGSLEAQPGKSDKHTFLGVDLVHSLGEVLHGAVPLLTHDAHVVEDEDAESSGPPETPLGARIITAVCAYDELTMIEHGTRLSPQNAVRELRRDSALDPEVVGALGRVVQRQTTSATPKPVPV